jgi:hypothetical protein
VNRGPHAPCFYDFTLSGVPKRRQEVGSSFSDGAWLLVDLICFD